MIDTGLRNKVALITGCNNPYGIGASTARAFAAQGTHVFLHYFCSLQGNPTAEAADEAAGQTFYWKQQTKTAAN